MYIKIKNQRKLIEKAVKQASSYRSLSKIIQIPRSSLKRYHNLESIPQERFEKIIKFLKINKNELKFKSLEDNWKQKIGGKNSVLSKIKKGIFKEQLRKAQKRGTIKLKEWHRKNKQDNPLKYHLLQYSKFKKIGQYKYETKNKEKVRNILEKNVADELYTQKISYEYEPLIKIKDKFFFPDFLIKNNIIIECTMWRGEIKAHKLKEKIKHLSKRYRVYVLIPKNIERYYKSLKKHLIFDIKDIKSE